MKTMQQGFTLIELMLVDAIIGILAAVAIPAYSDYIARAQMSEAMTLSSGVKTPLSEWISDQGPLPSITQLSATTSGKYVSNVSISGTPTAPVVTATMKPTGVSAGIASMGLSLSSTDFGASWTCSGTGGIDTKFLPGACK